MRLPKRIWFATEKTKILFLTEGLLLRQLAGDPTLDQYSVIIIDEVFINSAPLTNTTLSSVVNLPHVFDFRALCGVKGSSI